MPIGSSLTDRYYGHSYVRTTVRLLQKNAFPLTYGLQDANVFSEGTHPEGEGACRNYNKNWTYARGKAFFLQKKRYNRVYAGAKCLLGARSRIGTMGTHT